MAYETIVGRNRSDLEKYGSTAAGFIGRHIVGEGEDMHLTTKVLLDFLRPHMVLITGKRGTGKSYDAAVIAEEISRLPEEHRRNLAVVFIDTMGIFWSMKNPNDQQAELLREWKLEPKAMENVRMYVPYAQKEEFAKAGLPVDGGISIAPHEFSAEEWRLAFGLSATEPAGVAIEKTVNALTEAGGRFTLEDMIDRVRDDAEIAADVKDALANMLVVAAKWGVFGTEGTNIDELVVPGTITAVDVSRLRASEAWSVRNFVVAILARKIYQRRLIARKEEEVAKLELGEERAAGKSSFPMVWLMIDECLPYDSEIVTDKGKVPIGEIVREHKKGERFKVVGYDKRTKKYGFYEVRNSFVQGARNVIEVTTESGRKIRCTPNHMIFTRNGFFPAINATEIGSMPERTYASDYRSRVARLAGYIVGDGWLSKNGSVGFAGKGNEDDLHLIKNELSCMGLKSGSIHSKLTCSEFLDGNGSVIKVEGTSQHFSASRNAFRTFLELGLPVGDKIVTEFLLPAWITEAPEQEKCEFLAALMGADGLHPSVMKSDPKCFHVFRLTFNKYEKLEKNAFEYANQLKRMFESVGVKVSRISRRSGNIRKDGKKTMKIVITLSNSRENQLVFLEKVGFRYCADKEREAESTLSYMIAKMASVQKKKETFKKALELEKTGLSRSEISVRLGVPVSEVKSLLRKRKGKFWVGRSFPTYFEWKKNHYVDGVLYETITSRDASGKEPVYDIDVDTVHNFIADGFIVHNCHNFAPSDRANVSTEPLTTIAKQGREPGVSLAVITQMPNRLHQDILSQCDIVFAHRLTSRDDLEALHGVMQSYMPKELQQYIDALPRQPGACMILDDNLEKVFTVQIRPRLSWHAGGTATIV